MKVYTKTGDKGTTALFGGTRVPKDHARIESYGTVDELNSHIGLIRDQEMNSHYKEIVIEIQEISTKYKSIAAEKELLLQEFMPEIQTLGETSFIFFNKKFSHAVNKKPVDGDFRVQSLFGGKYNLVQPSQELINKAQKIADTFPENLLYARVDGILIENELYLMEIECIEPDLYFNLSENALERFVSAIVELIP